MAPLPQNNTHRLFFDYVTGTSPTSREHTVAVRYNPALRDVGDVQADFLAMLTAFGAASFRIGWKVQGVRVQAAGTDFSVPVTTIASLASFTGTLNTGYSASLEALEDTFQGRSTASGRRVDFSLYRVNALLSDNFRLNAGPSGAALIVGNVVNVLNARSALGSFLTIDGTPPAWRNYINQNFNSYWESRSRNT